MKAAALASEPFFRVNMGQRYLDSGAVYGGALVWLLAAAASVYGGIWGVRYGAVIGVALGVLLTVLFVALASADRSAALQRHFDNEPRHSMSRGEPRIADPLLQEFAKVFVAFVLLLFAAPAFALAVISMVFSAPPGG